MVHGQCLRLFAVATQGIDFLQKFTDNNRRRLHTVVAGAGTGITDIKRRTGAGQNLKKSLPVLIAPVPVTGPGFEAHSVKAIYAFTAGKIVAVHTQKTDQPRRYRAAMGQCCKSHSAAHEASPDRVTDASFNGIAQHRQRQRGTEPGDGAITGEGSESLAKPYQVIHLSFVYREETVQYLIADGNPTGQGVGPGQGLAKRNELL